MSHQTLVRILLPIATCVVIGLGWQLAVSITDISPLVLPSPIAILQNIATHPAAYLTDAWITVREALAGFVLAACLGVSMAIASVFSRTFALATAPLFAAMRSVPVVAFAPALVLWMGFGTAPKVVVAAAVAFPPIYVNAREGLSQVDDAVRDVMRVLDASQWEMLKKLRIPSAMPYFMSGARVALSLALVGAVVGEWAGSSEGLGYRIVRAQNDLETTVVWAATVLLGVIGVALTGGMRFVESRVCKRFR